jgi:hypothetical protein
MDNQRITAAIQIDEMFRTYEIEMTPPEAFAFVEIAPAAGVPKTTNLANLIMGIDSHIPLADLGQGHPKTGQPHHTYLVGRRGGQRLLKVEIFKGFFQRDYDFRQLLEAIHALADQAGAEVATEMGSTNAYSIEMYWPAAKEVNS